MSSFHLADTATSCRSSTQGALWLASDTYVFSLLTQSSSKERVTKPQESLHGRLLFGPQMED